MNATSDRRGFLRGLVTLPLIGGGVTLIGNPTAAAEPVTTALLDTYETWLDREKTWLRWERYGHEMEDRAKNSLGVEAVFRNIHTGEIYDRIWMNNAAGRHRYDRPAASTRAAVVLSAVGCDWRRDHV